MAHCVKTKEEKLVACFTDEKAAKTFIMLDGRAGLRVTTSLKGLRGVGKRRAARRSKRRSR